MRIDVWSDIACPWCYVGKRRLEAALALAPLPRVEVHWHAFELDPAAPRAPREALSYAERLARKYGISVGEAEENVARMTRAGAADGLELRFDRVRPTNTFDAHRLLHLAAERGRQDALKERLLRAYFTEGLDVGDREVLARLAAEIGLDGAEAASWLAGAGGAEAARADEAEAARLGIHGVPFFVFERKYAVSGAQPPELLRRAIDRALAEAPPQDAPAAGEACGPDGCAVPST